MDILFSNNASTTLSGGITDAELSLTVSSASGFPSPSGSQYFYATLQNKDDASDFEIVKVTDVTGAVFTIVRGQEGTTAKAWSDGTVVELRLTAGSISALQAHQADVGVYGGSDTFDGSSGATVSIGATLAGTSYSVSITPTANSEDVGAIYVTDKAVDSFVVRCTGSGTPTFDWVLVDLN